MTMQKLLMAAAAVVVSGSALLATAGPAHAKDVTVIAASPDELPRATVNIADLNLASASGQKTMTRRVGSAVRVVCAHEDTGALASNYRHCQDVAWDSARPQMARAIQRAEQLAATGSSSIAAAAISISAGAAQ